MLLSCLPTYTGLSPPTRGNRRDEFQTVPRGGSIPAHAGEPGAMTYTVIDGEVYPRPRGGTPSREARTSRRLGLSPPTRGNH